MFVQTIFVSVIAILMGLALLFVGYRLFLFILPIWAFLAVLSGTGTAITGLWGSNFFTTILSWVLGILFGLVAACLAYLFYYAAVIILAGVVGYQLGVGFMTWIGFRLGLIAILIGLALALVFAFGAWFLKAPKILIIILTALAGASSLLAGFFLAFGTIPLSDLQWGAVGAIVRQSWWWTLVYLALAAIGFAAQWRMTAASYTVENYSREIVIA